MSPIPNQAISACLIGIGVFAWAFAGRGLIANPELRIPLNPLGINGSPYGEVFAMAMQGPVDTNFNGAMGFQPNYSAVISEKKSPAAGAVKPPVSLEGRLRWLLESFDKVAGARTNPKAANSALRYYLRRQVEDKLRFAYHLDPAHYGNFTSLYFFLTQPSLGTRKELTPSATKLAEDTIRYCLKQEHDPRPALTAAAALTDILELMFTDFRTGSTRFSITQMREKLEMLDVCLARYSVISQQWDLTKNWDLLSPMRQYECEERSKFIRKMRDTALNTITRIETETQKVN
jgi:hypothetical protein